MLAAFTKSGYLLLHDYLELTVSSVEATAAESCDSLLEGLEAADLFDSQESQLHHHDVIESQDVQMNIVESEDSLASKPGWYHFNIYLTSPLRELRTLRVAGMRGVLCSMRCAGILTIAPAASCYT